jgi:DNA-directed RNA polymerase specialized sigma subunit
MRKVQLVELAIQALRSQLGKLPNDAEIAQEMELAVGAYGRLLDELSGLGFEAIWIQQRCGSNEMNHISKAAGQGNDIKASSCGG